MPGLRDDRTRDLPGRTRILPDSAARAQYLDWGLQRRLGTAGPGRSLLLSHGGQQLPQRPAVNPQGRTCRQPWSSVAWRPQTTTRTRLTTASSSSPGPAGQFHRPDRTLRVLEVLGCGGFGIVFRAPTNWRTAHGRGQGAGRAGRATSPARKRFVHEGPVVKIRHENVVETATRSRSNRCRTW